MEVRLMYNRWLAHFGIKGMKWGVRRYQNRDGTLTAEGKQRLKEASKNYKNEVANDIVFKKGQSFDRVGSKGEKDEGSTFVTFKDADRTQYRANVEVLPIYEQAYKLKLKAIDDIKVAGAKAQTEILLDYLGDKSFADVYAYETTRGYSNSNNYKRIYKRELQNYRKLYADVLSGEKDYTEVFDDAFSRFVDRKSDVALYMTEKLQQKGYDAVIDLWDVGFSECPIYVFDRKKKLKTTSRSELTQDEKDEAIEEIYRKLEKEERK